MITLGKREWLPGLKEIWKEAFGDEGEVIDDFHRSFFRPDRCWCVQQEEQPVSVIYGIPAQIWLEDTGKRKKSLVYLYAGATAREVRGQGCYGELMDFFSRQKEWEEIPFLVPAEGLGTYYERHGFSSIYEREELLLEKEEEIFPLRQSSCASELIACGNGQSSCASELIACGSGQASCDSGRLRLGGYASVSQYKKIRDCRLGRTGYIEWDEKALSYAIGERRPLILFWGEEEHVLLGSLEGKRMKILETTLSDSQLEQGTAGLCQLFGCQELYRKGIAFMSPAKEWPETLYFGLPMDE